MSKKNHDPIKLIPKWARDKPNKPLYKNLMEKEDIKEVHQDIFCEKYPIQKHSKIKYGSEYEPKGVIRMTILNKPEEIFYDIANHYESFQNFIPSVKNKILRCYLGWKLLPPKFSAKQVKDIVQNRIGRNDVNGYLISLVHGGFAYQIPNPDEKSREYYYQFHSKFTTDTNDTIVIEWILKHHESFYGYSKPKEIKEKTKQIRERPSGRLFGKKRKPEPEDIIEYTKEELVEKERPINVSNVVNVPIVELRKIIEQNNSILKKVEELILQRPITATLESTEPDEFDELRDQWNDFQGIFPNIEFGDFLIMAGRNIKEKTLEEK